MAVHRARCVGDQEQLVGHTLPIPCDLTLVGGMARAQGFRIDMLGGVFSCSFLNAIDVLIGNW